MNKPTGYWRCDKCGELRDKIACDACKTPPYNIESATLKKFRRNAKDGLATWSKWERHMYGAAVEQAVLAKQRSEFMRALPPIPQASVFGAALVKKQRNELLAYPAQVRRERTPKQWQEMYDKAMKEKRT